MLGSMDLESTVVKAADIANPLWSSPSGPLEGMAMAPSFESRAGRLRRCVRQSGVLRTEAGVPLRTTRTSGERWFEQFHGADAGLQEMQ